MKSYPVNLGQSGKDGLPAGLFDPRWKDPAVAARVAFTVYCRVPFHDDKSPRPLTRDFRSGAAALTDARTFPLVHEHVLDDGTRVKCGSYGELHRRYSFGTHTANFHAQTVVFAADSRGRFLLSAVVGRFDGPWGNDATLSATFSAGAQPIGAVVWTRAMDPAGDHRVVVTGVDAALATAFPALDRAALAFTARTGIEAAPSESAPKLSRAKRSALEAALAAARAAGNSSEVARIEAALHAGRA
ncbi:MAG TPA: hypothetical protein VGO62_16600 [Myxococcota bacterium]